MAGKKLNKLSERQRNILRFVQRYTSQKDYPPTIREIGEATGINSTSVVNYNLNKLVEAGLVERSDRVSRGLRLTGEAAGVRKRVSAGAAGPRVPLIGMIVASEPAAIPDDSGHYYDDDDLIEVPSSLLAGNDPEQVYALKVRGDSMMDAMIQEGDIVILRRQNTASQGEMVAVWLPNDSQTTLKYYFPEGEKIRLQPAHPTMSPIMVEASNCQIRGRVLSVIRKL